MRHLAAFAVLALAFAPAIASEPGQPLDASDFVFLLPGLSAREQLPRGCAHPWCWTSLPSSQTPYDLRDLPVDVEGSQYAFKQEGLPNCNGTTRLRNYLVRLRSSSTPEDVGYIDDRCVPNTASAADRMFLRTVRIDNNGGCLYLVVTTELWGNTSPAGTAYPPEVSNESLIRLCGLSTQFEILSTYEPLTSRWSLRVPYMPEGFQSADAFDSYHGDLAMLPDWSQAQPLQCDFPQTPPSVGEYLTVADTLPDPAPGQGRYYVTAVRHAGETRFGRQNIAGTLAGRNPATFPACSGR